MIPAQSLEPEARAVVAALRRFRDRIDEILALLEGRSSLRLEEKVIVRELLRSLKADLKSAAKTGSISGTRRPLNRYEDAYFAPATQAASANLRAAVNTDPIRSNWYSSLYGVRIDIDHPLSQLERRFSDE